MTRAPRDRFGNLRWIKTRSMGAVSEREFGEWLDRDWSQICRGNYPELDEDFAVTRRSPERRKRQPQAA